MDFFEGNYADIRKAFNEWSTEDHWIQDSEFLKLEPDISRPKNYQVMKVTYILKSEIKGPPKKSYAKR
jgi:hypothetical protein